MQQKLSIMQKYFYIIFYAQEEFCILFESVLRSMEMNWYRHPYTESSLFTFARPVCVTLESFSLPRDIPEESNE